MLHFRCPNKKVKETDPPLPRCGHFNTIYNLREGLNHSSVCQAPFFIGVVFLVKFMCNLSQQIHIIASCLVYNIRTT